MDHQGSVLDYSHQKLKKLNKPTASESHVTELILDDNELQRLDNIDSFVKLEKLSACHNQLLRMYGVCRLHNLHTLNLVGNGILTIEGLKELTGLKWLSLSGNNIKTIEHLNTNVNLEYLDLSENSITHIGDISFLKNLRELYLHKNRINHLVHCDKFLPTSITTLTLAYNNIGDLNEISRLAHLVNLTKISISNNPCVNMAGNNIGFDYRPFVINWCLNVNVIDDYVVDAIESLRAEWLYSQGRGRHFRVGDQKELTQYLAAVCPLTGEQLETEEDRKLRLILSKAQHHQQQLREQSSNNTPQPSPASRKKNQQSRNSPRLNSLRHTSNKPGSPDRMATSCYGNLGGDTDQSIMSQSLDPSLLRQSIMSQSMTRSMHESVNNFFNVSEKYLDEEPVNSPLQALSKMVPVPESLMSPDYRPGPIIGKSPSHTNSTPTHNFVPNSKVSQIVRSPKATRVASATPGTRRSQLNTDASRKGGGSPSPGRQRRTVSASHNKPVDMNNRKTSILRTKSPSSEDECEMYNSKLQMIQMKAEERRQQKEAELLSNSSNEEKIERAVVKIQKVWRGYYTRNKDKEVQEVFRTLQNQRASQYIQKLASDMETTKAALESERKIQMLQTEAISALWKKISSLQSSNEGSPSPSTLNMTNLSQNNTEVVKDLAQTCSVLQNQIQQLQSSMQDIVKVMTVFSQTAGIHAHLKENGIATQTEIIAVHTPQGDAAKIFPFQKNPPNNIQQSRPSSLPLPVKATSKTPQSGGVLNPELKQLAGSLIDGVIQTVSERGTDNDEENDDKIEITQHKNDN